MAGPSTAFGEKAAPNSAQDDRVVGRSGTRFSAISETA
jgi:hypothetical protein